MTEKKAKELFNNTNKIIENKLKEIELIQFLLNGGRISFKKGDLDTNAYMMNDGGYDQIFDDNYEYILGYGITNTRFIENYLDNGFSKEDFEKDYAKSFQVSLYSLQLPFVDFYFTIKKKDYVGLENIIPYLISKNVPLNKFEVDLALEKKLNDKYAGKHIYIPEINVHANIEYVYMVDKNLKFGVEGYRGSFLIDSEKVEIKENRLELSELTDGNKEKEILIRNYF